MKDNNINYKLFMKQEDRGEQKRDEDPYISRQFTEKKLKKIEKWELIGVVEYLEMTAAGMPKKTKIYYLTEKGFHHVCRAFKFDKHDVRYGKPLDIHMGHELNISRILQKIYFDAERKDYQISYARADRALRSIFHEKSGGMSPKGIHFLDLRVEIICKSGRLLKIPLELANIKDDPDFWKDKIKNIEEPFFILTKNQDFVKVICRWIQEIKVDHVMFVAPLEDFLRLGFLDTIWQKVMPSEVQLIKINLD